MAHPIRAIFHTRSKVEHEKRRQVWAPGLSTKALKAYQPRIESNVASLVQQIDGHNVKGENINVSRWFNYLSFDVMGDVGFGKSFGMLEKGEKTEVLRKLADGQKGLGVFGVVPWLFMILTKIPAIRQEHDVFVEWCSRRILDRAEVACLFPRKNSRLTDTRCRDRQM
jgi:cytochrome P450